MANAASLMEVGFTNAFLNEVRQKLGRGNSLGVSFFRDNTGSYVTFSHTEGRPMNAKGYVLQDGSLLWAPIPYVMACNIGVSQQVRHSPNKWETGNVYPLSFHSVKAGSMGNKSIVYRIHAATAYVKSMGFAIMSTSNKKTISDYVSTWKMNTAHLTQWIPSVSPLMQAAQEVQPKPLQVATPVQTEELQIEADLVALAREVARAYDSVSRAAPKSALGVSMVDGARKQLLADLVARAEKILQ